MKLPIAAQVYSLRDEAAADFGKAMDALARMGYDGVELAGLYGKPAKEIRACLDRVGLAAVSAHVPYEALAQDTERTVVDYQEIGCKFVAIPGFAKEDWYGGSRYAKTLENIAKISETCRKAGMRLLYHNHESEFTKTPAGIYELDAFYGDIPASDIQTQLDLCWVKVGGADPVAYLHKYSGRCPLVHMKDYICRDGEVLQVALGDGEVGMEALASASIESGAEWFVIEQDDHPFETPMANMEKSLRQLRACLG